MRSIIFLFFLIVEGLLTPLYSQDTSSVTVSSLIEQGQQQYFSHHYREAVALYKQALAISAQNPQALYELAWAYFDLAEYPHSLEAATEATLYPSILMDELYALIGANYYYTMTVAVYESELDGRTDEEVRVFKQRAQQAEDGSLRLFKLGLTYMTSGEVKKAIATYIESLQLNPDYPEAHLELAKALDYEGHYEIAALAYSYGLFLNPTMPFASRILVRMENCLAKANLPKKPFSPHIVPEGTPKGLATTLPAIIDRIAQQNNPAVQYYLPWFKELADSSYLESFGNYLYQGQDKAAYAQWQGKEATKLQVLLDWANLFSWPNPEPIIIEEK